jgi:hypothetical protein
MLRSSPRRPLPMDDRGPADRYARFTGFRTLKDRTDGGSIARRMGPHFLADGLVEGVDARGGRGIFAARRLEVGELVSMWGGDVLTLEELAQLPEHERDYAVQIEEGLVLTTPVAETATADFINHSCEPNLGLDGPISLRVMREILPGDELSFDYAMTDSTPLLEFDCTCGAALCRGRVTGEDWRLPRLRAIYDGHFTPYLQRRIDAERALLATVDAPVVTDANWMLTSRRRRMTRAGAPKV